MSNRSCEDCKWDKLNPQGLRLIQCGQGHARTRQEIIEDCHAWEGNKEKCWCEIDNMDVWKYRKWNYCPKCGKKLED